MPHHAGHRKWQKMPHPWAIRPKWYENFLGKVPENPEIVEFPKSELFNRKSRKFWDESQMERKFLGKKMENLDITRVN